MTPDDGFASPLLVSLIALAGLLCLATADAANVLVTRARVQTAADAASLAAAAVQWTGEGDPRDAAEDVAERNSAVLDGCDCERHGQASVVTVSAPTRTRMLGVAPRRVSARAEARVDVGRLFEP